MTEVIESRFQGVGGLQIHKTKVAVEGIIGP